MYTTTDASVMAALTLAHVALGVKTVTTFDV